MKRQKQTKVWKIWRPSRDSNPGSLACYAIALTTKLLNLTVRVLTNLQTWTRTTEKSIALMENGHNPLFSEIDKDKTEQSQGVRSRWFIVILFWKDLFSQPGKWYLAKRQFQLALNLILIYVARRKGKNTDSCFFSEFPAKVF